MFYFEYHLGLSSIDKCKAMTTSCFHNYLYYYKLDIFDSFQIIFTFQRRLSKGQELSEKHNSVTVSKGIDIVRQASFHNIDTVSYKEKQILEDDPDPQL